MSNTRARLHRALADDAAQRSPSVTVAPVGSAPITRRRFKPGPNGPLRLTDAQLDAIMHAAEPLKVDDRDAFLQDVAAALQGRDLGDGTVYRTIAQAQKRYFDPPLFTAGPSRKW
jgi:hypothetical protein